MINSKQILHLLIVPLRYKIPPYIMRVHAWSATTFAGNIKIFLTRLVPRAIKTTFLQPCSSVIRLSSTDNSTRPQLSETGLPHPHGTNLKSFSSKVLENLPHL